MKKLLALLLSAALLTGTALPALGAEEASADAKLAQVTQAVKERLDLDTSGYDEFHGESWQQELATVWQLDWSGEEGSLSVQALEDGTIVSYVRSDGEDGIAVWGESGSLPAFPQGDPEVAAAAAEAFLAKVLDPALETVRLEEPQGERLGADSYRFSGSILLHGIPSPLSYSVTVRATDNQVTRFSRDALATTCLGGVPGPETAVTAAQAGETLRGTLALRLEYVLPEADSTQAVLRYLPERGHEYYVDAKTGELVDLTALEEKMYQAGGGDAAAGESATDEALSNSGALTEAEQEGIRKLEGVQSSDELDTALRAVPEYGLEDYTLANSRYQLVEEDGGEEQVLCHLTYSRSDGENVYRRTFTVDARTGGVQSVWSSAPWDEGRTPAFTTEEAQARAEAFLAAYYGDHAAHLALYDTTDRTAEGAPSFTFTFTRQENGIFFPEDSYTVGIDAADGSVSGLNFQYHEDVTFQSPEGIVDAEAALDAWMGTYEVALSYLLVPRPLVESDPTEARLIQLGLTHFYGLELGYGLERREGSWIGVDAKTGEALQREATPAEGPSYDDLEGHWAQAEVERLARYGVGYASASFQPGRALTQADLVCLLASTQGSWLLLDPEAATAEELDEAYAAVYRMGALTRQERQEDALLTRSDVVRMLLDAAGYGRVARLEGIFTCAFSDRAEIPDSELGYAALAQALGLAQETYAGARTATRAEAAVMLCRLLEG